MRTPVQCVLLRGLGTDISTEAFRCPEALFQPSIIGSNFTGVSETMYQAIQRCDEDVRRDMFKNVVLTGGSTMFKGES